MVNLLLFIWPCSSLLTWTQGDTPPMKAWSGKLRVSLKFVLRLQKVKVCLVCITSCCNIFGLEVVFLFLLSVFQEVQKPCSLLQPLGWLFLGALAGGRWLDENMMTSTRMGTMGFTKSSQHERPDTMVPTVCLRVRMKMSEKLSLKGATGRVKLGKTDFLKKTHCPFVWVGACQLPDPNGTATQRW